MRRKPLELLHIAWRRDSLGGAHGGNTMKKVSTFLALWLLFFAGLALANTAIVTAAAGSVQAQTGTAPARALRVGDQVRQADTIITGPASSAVLKFEDGQVAALTANSRMTITAYQYNPQTQSGNVLLSLIDGGMRAITGLIGRRSPDNVAYRAATATIGIRGTDITIVTSGGNIVVTVAEGIISYRVGNNPPVTVNAGQAIATTNERGTIRASAAAIIAALPAELGVVATNVTQAIAQISAAITTALATGNTGTTTGNPAVVDVRTQPSGGGVGASCAGQICTCPSGEVLTGTTCTCPSGLTRNSAGICSPP